jgi:hypothetical protein
MPLSSGPFIVRWATSPSPLQCDIGLRDLLPGSRMVVTIHLEDEAQTVRR